MHTHWLQDEVFTVINGRLGYQIMGEPEKFAGEGETVVFKKAVPHRFWNDGKEILHCTGYMQPANSIVFFFLHCLLHKISQGKVNPKG
jgi:quercetin dioxygenase-like cupin family protein